MKGLNWRAKIGRLSGPMLALLVRGGTFGLAQENSIGKRTSGRQLSCSVSDLESTLIQLLLSALFNAIFPGCLRRRKMKTPKIQKTIRRIPIR